MNTTSKKVNAINDPRMGLGLDLLGFYFVNLGLDTTFTW